MKNIVYKLLIVLTVIGLSACDDNEAPVFIAAPSGEGITFTNTFASEYLLSEATEDNIADRFIWGEADFGTETNITYELQGSIDPTFAAFEQIGSTSENNLPVLVSQLLSFAEQLGLDDDPATTQPDSDLPNNTGQVYFRLRAYLGSGAANTEEIFSDIQSINIHWIETVAVGGSCDSLFAVGAGLADLGWNFTNEGEVLCENDILQIKARFTNDKFRLFTEFGVWDTSYGFNYYTDEGYTIDALLVDSNVYDAGDGDDNFWFDGDAGIYTMVIDNVNKTIVLTPSGSLWAVGGAVPGGWAFNDDTVELVEATPDVWSASITLSNEIFRFFQTFNVWDTNNNYTYYEDEGFTIDSNFEINADDGDANFRFIGAPGTYTLTINAVDKTITLE
ncbi:SusE domain-containing protein [Flaviramulus sp. BrNp1-15]|uniref:SusE domain-containing protein n=1 Tax=Flaviramulus sp. BrNp1-15 TaxID=2916754 RepID=UPI001EE94A03|nr:SusE domain-containing protein [Flaviramulus sp. BrNp1-15]ULC60364.1 SusE domain-containing protein [Flaviramulus sp. BrNp1-15]